MKKILKDAKEFQKTFHLPKKQRTAYSLSDHSSDSDNDVSIPVPLELDLTHLPSSDNSSSSSDGLSNQEINLDKIQDDIELNNATISINEDLDDVVSGSDDGSFVTKVNNANMSCQYPSFYDTIMSHEHDTDAHKALMKEQI